jgi:hypothetical protein
MEHIDFTWLKTQSQLGRPIVMLSDFNTYQDYHIPNVSFHRWTVWHHALNKMIALFGTAFEKDIRYKASAFCNRITQSKMLITTALLETLGKEHCLTSLSDWAEEKNVHGWHHTGNAKLDNLTDIFRQKYFKQKWSMDNFDNSQNFQHYTANPAQIAYQQAVIHFTNESFHYSYMIDDGNSFILPGPHLTEKTFKCLLGGTAFVPVGQFDVYATLTKLGMQFDYGLDLSFDQDPGNLTRMEKIVDLIQEIANYSCQELWHMTQDSSQHNQNLIISQEFFKSCQTVNETTLDHLQKVL